MRRFIVYILLILSSAAVFSSCDHLRRLAGRPTSEDIAAIRERIVADSISRADSIAKVQAAIQAMKKAEEDMKEALAIIGEEGMYIKKLSETAGLRSGTIPARYAIVTGGYSQHSNTMIQINSFSSDLNASYITLGNGLEAVLVVPSDNLLEVAKKIPSVRAQRMCPKGIWVLENDMRE
ncbi:MAG: hypothetical protein MJY67_05280 [Bacteroidales bacterium]|nr:hypothetical protein [Bacteroidales bacterium]